MTPRDTHSNEKPCKRNGRDVLQSLGDVPSASSAIARVRPPCSLGHREAGGPDLLDRRYPRPGVVVGEHARVIAKAGLGAMAGLAGDLDHCLPLEDEQRHEGRPEVVGPGPGQSDASGRRAIDPIAPVRPVVRRPWGSVCAREDQPGWGDQMTTALQVSRSSARGSSRLTERVRPVLVDLISPNATARSIASRRCPMSRHRSPKASPGRSPAYARTLTSVASRSASSPRSRSIMSGGIGSTERRGSCDGLRILSTELASTRSSSTAKRRTTEAPRATCGRSARPLRVEASPRASG